MLFNKIRAHVKTVLKKMGFRVIRISNPVVEFHSHRYLRHNARRLEHLASLRIPVAGMSVLEVGAGIGDHTHYFLDRGCKVIVTEARTENLSYLRKRYPGSAVRYLDMEDPIAVEGAPCDVVHCYGLLYHLGNPQAALSFLAKNTRRLLFLETCVSFGNEEEIGLTGEDQSSPTQALSGTGCRPTRPWIYGELGKHFEYVYLPKTQPCHEEFPIDWSAPHKHKQGLQRAVFIASREPLENDMLTPELIMKQVRHA